MSSSTLTQTLLLFLAPFLLPRLIRFVTAFLYPKAAPPHGNDTLASSPFLSTRHIEPALPPRLKLARLCLVTVTISSLLARSLIPTDNLFLHLAPSRSLSQTFFPVLRTPIELKISTMRLQQLWSRHKTLNDQVRSRKTKGHLRCADSFLIPSLPPHTKDHALLSRLSTLDARELYLSYGPSPLLHCTWCSPTSSFDYILVLLPSIALKYLIIATIDSILLMGSQGRRKRWRVYVVGALGVGFAGEVYARWSNVGSGNVMMIDAFLHLLIPSLLWVPTLLASYLLPPSPIQPTTPTLLQPHLQNLLSLSQTSLCSIRSTHLHKMALMTHYETRELVHGFWEGQERELRWAKGDKVLKEVLRGVEIGEEERRGLGLGKEDRDRMRKVFGIGCGGQSGSDGMGNGGVGGEGD
ncbi:BZ3500_MvSof-1268-A1-R1_Chr4-2g07130 [Microbotryum saponariae]|uniref:BZ3500_MvSof-1268-A1-R1_Chr4-2g07130 protein n=1 Tax=Microbotryum saponariae TaxID=289078 RepID=A0A2X0KTS8_9BASI|nr:BZ3500_MvSof-1268-A1-R1_Chr4-2g07130 [Microbotryum saponariae]SDA06795.1 BZ3501_MvSof-1269-A2-R1_Chr4-2g06841 [Microbotryum saponariae]